VATAGEPRSEITEVVVDVDSGTRIETFFRNISGVASPADKPPGDTRAPAEGPGSAKGKSSDPRTSDTTRGSGAKVTKFQASDLKTGLFVEVDFRRDDNDSHRNRATTVSVIRPVLPSAEPAATEGKSGGRK
jgi:hypothetical protein